MSTMRKTAAATDNAQANSNPMTVAFVGARRPKVTKSSPARRREGEKRPRQTFADCFRKQPVSLCYVAAYLQRS